jgi:hypothetical protein
MRMAVVILLVFAPITGCIKDISSEERLERAVPPPFKDQTLSESDLKSVACTDTSAELAKARVDNKPEPERLAAYMELYESLKKKTATYEQAMKRNPDLHYQEGSQALVAARDLCIQQMSDVRLEFEQFTRELVEVPTVQEIKGGNMVVVARLDFNVIRQALDSLDPDDKETLLNRLASAEKKIETAPEKGKKKK